MISAATARAIRVQAFDLRKTVNGILNRISERVRSEAMAGATYCRFSFYGEAEVGVRDEVLAELKASGYIVQECQALDGYFLSWQEGGES